MIESHGGHTPRVHESAFVHATAVVIGEVEIEARASVWPTAVLRGDMGLISIGEETSIQDGTICHDTGDRSVTRIGRRVTVGHRVILHGCTVEDECLIGMGSILMDNVVIGRGSLIGAGAVISPGKIIPPNSVVLGNPGRVVRETGDMERFMIEHGWRAYVEKIPGYKR